MISIHERLRRDDIRFVLLNGKKPFEKEWELKGYKYNDTKLLNWISNGGNYGVIGGFGNIRILDCDNEQFAIEMLHDFPATFTVKTGSGGYHLYFFSDYNTNHVLKDKIGELRANNYQAVGGNCIHPNGNRYEVIDSDEIAVVSSKQLMKILKPYIRKETLNSTLTGLKIEFKGNCNFLDYALKNPLPDGARRHYFVSPNIAVYLLNNPNKEQLEKQYIAIQGMQDRPNEIKNWMKYKIKKNVKDISCGALIKFQLQNNIPIKCNACPKYKAYRWMNSKPRKGVKF